MMRRFIALVGMLVLSFVCSGEENTSVAELVKDTITLGTMPGTVLKHNHIYQVKDSGIVIDATDRPGVSALRVPVGAAVIIELAAGVKFEVRGGHGYGKIPGGAGIEVPYGAKLIITGGKDSELIAYGGNAAKGGAGYGGLDGEWGAFIAPDKITDDKQLPCPRSQIPPPDIQNGISSTNFCQEPLVYGRAGCGGIGGTGGGGAGAGIGGIGGGGGEGGLGGISKLVATKDVYQARSQNLWDSCVYFGIAGYFWFDDGHDGMFAEDGTAGSAGRDGNSGRSCGEIVIAEQVTVRAYGGSAGAGGAQGNYGHTLKTTADQEKSESVDILKKGRKAFTVLGGMDDSLLKAFGKIGDVAKRANPVMKVIKVLEMALDKFGYFAIDKLSKLHWYTGGGGGAGGAGGAAALGGIGQGGAGGGGGGGGGAGLFELGPGCVYPTSWLGKPDAANPIDLSGHGGLKGIGFDSSLTGANGANVPLVDEANGRPYNSKGGHIGAWSWVSDDGNWAWGGRGANGGQPGATNAQPFNVWVASMQRCQGLAANAVVNEFGGALEHTLTFKNGNTTLGGYKCITGTLCGPAPIAGQGPSGQYFTGYYTKASGGVQYFDRFCNPAYGAAVTNDLTLYAQWTSTNPDQRIKTVEVYSKGTYPSGTELESERIYHFTESVELFSLTKSALSLKPGRTVFYIDEGKTVTLTGSRGSVRMPGYPGLEVPEGAELIVVGGGRLSAKGGAAGDGENGGDGEKAQKRPHNRADGDAVEEVVSYTAEEIVAMTNKVAEALKAQRTNDAVRASLNDTEMAQVKDTDFATLSEAEIDALVVQYEQWLRNPVGDSPVNGAEDDQWNGKGGYGGAGGGGAAPAIGGRGGWGAESAVHHPEQKWKYTDKCGSYDEGKGKGQGATGNNGGNGAGMGSVYLLCAKVDLKAGESSAASAAAGKEGGSVKTDGALWNSYYAGGGGGGGGGSSGGSVKYAIGGGGAGGAGGGSGGAGGFFGNQWVGRSEDQRHKLVSGCGGQGASGDVNLGCVGGATAANHPNQKNVDAPEKAQGGVGGNAGNPGSRGGDGFLAFYPTIELQGLDTPRQYEVVWGHPALERTIYFTCEGQTNGSVIAQMGMPLPIIPSNILYSVRGYAMACAYQVKNGVTNYWYGIEGDRLHNFEGLDDVTLEVEVMPRWEAMALLPEQTLVDYGYTNVVAFDAKKCPWCTYVSGTTNATDAGLYRYSVKMSGDCEIWSDLMTNQIHEIEWRIFKVAITNEWVTNQLCYSWTKTPRQNLDDLHNYEKSLGFIPPAGVKVTFNPVRQVSVGYYALEASLDGGQNFFNRTMYGAYRVDSPIHVSFVSRYPWNTKLDALAMKRGTNDNEQEVQSALDAFQKIYGGEDLIASIPLATTNAFGESYVDIKIGKVEKVLENFSTITTIDLAPYADRLNMPRTGALDIYAAIGSNRFDYSWTPVDMTATAKTDGDGTWPLYAVDRQEDVYSIRCSKSLADNPNSISNVLLSIGKGQPAGDWFAPRRASGGIINDDRVVWRPVEANTYVLEHLITDADNKSNGYYRAYFNYTGEPPEPAEENVVAIVTRRSGWQFKYTTLAAAVADLGYGDTILIVGDVQMESEKIPSGTTVLLDKNGIFRAPKSTDLRRPYHRTVETNGVTNASGYRYELDPEQVRPQLGEDGDLPAIVLEKDEQGRIVRFNVLVRNMKGDLYYTLKRSDDLKTWTVVSKETPGTPEETAGYVAGPADGDKGFYRVEVTDDPAPAFTGVVGAGKTLTLTGASTAVEGGELILPATIGGNQVTAIGAGAFSNRLDITSVEISEGVTNIDAFAFYGCANLKSVMVPSTLKAIGERAFGGCLSLKGIVLPDGIRSIGAASFASTGMSELCLPASVQEGASPGLTQGGQMLYVDPGARFGSLELKPGCLADGTVIAYWKRFDFAFNEAGTGLVISNANVMMDGRLEIPSSIGGVPVVEIGAASFTNRSDIAAAVVPDSVVRVAHAAFCGCANLHEASFGVNVAELGANIFAFDRSQLVTNLFFAGSKPRISESMGLDTNSTIYVTSNWTTNKVETWQGCKVILLKP